MSLTLTLLCGLPAAGKSTWAARHCAALVVSADAIREQHAPAAVVFDTLYSRAAAALSAGQNVVIDACSLTRAARSRARDLARAHGAACDLVFFLTPWHVCASRDAQREQPAGVNVRSALALDAAYRDVVHEHYRSVRYVR